MRRPGAQFARRSQPGHGVAGGFSTKAIRFRPKCRTPDPADAAANEGLNPGAGRSDSPSASRRAGIGRDEAGGRAAGAVSPRDWVMGDG